MRILFGVLLCLLGFAGFGQGVVSGAVFDDETGEPVFSCNVIIKGTTTGVTTDFDGKFEIEVKSLPTTLQFSFISYLSKEVEIKSYVKNLVVTLAKNEIMLSAAEIVGERISDKQKQAPLTMESMDVLAIKDAASGNFYESLGNLKGVDMTSASLGFKIINTRGFNSTSPVRTLQLIDGVDNQSPGLNFSLGNFLGASDLDVMKVDIIAGASSAFYGPGAFNGVIQMTTKNPFIFPGFSMYMKKGERGLWETAFRFAEVIKNDKGEDKFAYKLNFFKMQAKDWSAENYDPILGSPDDESNPYGYDAVNVYGDEPIALNNDNRDAPSEYSGLGVWYRRGYKESELVNYDTDNMKFNTGLFYKLNPEVTASYNFNYSTGNTIFQGDNRYALRNVQFFQHKFELKEEDKWFIRAYSTNEDAGNTYDIVTTAIRMLDESGTTTDWNTRFASLWTSNFTDLVKQQPMWQTIFDQAVNSGLEGEEQFAYWQQLLDGWYHDDYEFFHDLYLQNVENTNSIDTPFLDPYYESGTTRFDSLRTDVTGKLFNEGGARFYDKSRLSHVHGEYKTRVKYWDLTIGANARWYRPDTRGTIFKDTLQYTYLTDSLGQAVLDEQGRRVVTDSVRIAILNQEWGAYFGAQHLFLEDKLKFNATVRVDKNQNFNFLVSPALSLVYTPSSSHTFRSSFSSAIRNPTLADQYLFYNVGRATLLGNIDGRFEQGVDSLFTIDSFNEYRNSSSLSSGLSKLDYFNVEKIRPEKVKTIEVGYRGTWFDNTYIDAVAYTSIYTDFIGYNIGLNGKFNPSNGFPDGGIQVFRVAANAREKVRTFGISAGVNYYFKHLSLNGNYSFNKLVSDNNDPIIPAFNTPLNKFNLGLGGRNLKFLGSENFGFGVNYKWIQGFLFEGSPQFSGNVPSYDMVDAQVNVSFPKSHTTLKVGGSNLFGILPLFDKENGKFGQRIDRAINNNNIQVYGGPRVGRLMYISVFFEIK